MGHSLSLLQGATFGTLTCPAALSPHRWEVVAAVEKQWLFFFLTVGDDCDVWDEKMDDKARRGFAVSSVFLAQERRLMVFLAAGAA